MPYFSGFASDPDYRKIQFYSSIAAWFKNMGVPPDKNPVDLLPNPAFFNETDPGTLAGNPLTFVPGEINRPNGDSKYYSGLYCRTFEWEKDVIREGLVSEESFEVLTGIGPFSLEVGESVTIAYARGAGVRLEGLRQSMQAARAVWNSRDANGRFNLPLQPPSPDMEVEVSPEVRPQIKWSQITDTTVNTSGYRIYKSRSWPKYNSLENGIIASQYYDQAEIPGDSFFVYPRESQVASFSILQQHSGEWWGPYQLVADLSITDLANYQNSESDHTTYPYMWVDTTAGTIPGMTFWYYVAAYSNQIGNFAGIGSYNRLESGKLNFNGRSGSWESTYPMAPLNNYYPSVDDLLSLKKIGAPFVLVPPVSKESELLKEEKRIKVRPNPYKKMAFHDVGTESKLFFYNLPERCKISIFDISGQLIDVIDFHTNNYTNGSLFWDMHSRDGLEIASGVYLWVAEFPGGSQYGYFSVLK